MGAPRVDDRRAKKYRTLRAKGFSLSEACRKAEVSRGWAYQQERADGKERVTDPVTGRRVTIDVREAGAIPYDELIPEAKRAWNDFAYFQKRYLGRIATPWQVEAALRVVAWLESPDKEYVVINVAPGAGKSTVFTHDIPCWLTVRNRAIRGQIGSKVESSAKKYVQRLRRTFEASTPITNEAELVARGLALNAEATLAADYGIFRPEARDVWAAEAFLVEQMGGLKTTEKEPTWSAYGMDSGFLGMRYDFVIWDDLVDPGVMKTTDSRENQQKWWDDVAEKRLDPGGLLVLQGQRMGADDLYRYALDKREIMEDEDLEELDGDNDLRPAKYQHVVFKAHYDDRCQGLHKTTDPYYPEGCLLDPRRLTWRELRQEMANKRNNFAVIYQQEDVDPQNVLVDMLWVKGGQDSRTHEYFPGCLDRERDLCELPHGLFGQLLSVATADPSPTKYWSIQWWVVRCVDGQPYERYLMDHIRQAMDAPSFLDWNNPTQTFTGIMEEWQKRSVDLGLPITTWIVEANAAQRFMLQFEHVRRWTGENKVRLIPHQTQRNKSDPQYGVQTLAGIYRAGLVRLPYKSGGKAFMHSHQLIEEVTTWPEGRSDDCVMAQWFLEWSLPHLVPTGRSLPKMNRPSWLKNVDTFGWRRGVSVG